MNVNKMSRDPQIWNILGLTDGIEVDVEWD